MQSIEALSAPTKDKDASSTNKRRSQDEIADQRPAKRQSVDNRRYVGFRRNSPYGTGYTKVGSMSFKIELFQDIPNGASFMMRDPQTDKPIPVMKDHFSGTCRRRTMMDDLFDKTKGENPEKFAEYSQRYKRARQQTRALSPAHEEPESSDEEEREEDTDEYGNENGAALEVKTIKEEEEENEGDKEANSEEGEVKDEGEATA